MNFVGIRRVFTALALLVGGVFYPTFATTIVLQPVADTTLVEAAPDNNLGATTFVNAGKAGANGARNRALYKFDFGPIPPNSKIKSAVVTLEVTTEPSGGGESSIFELHRMLRSWGEGDKNSAEVGSPGLGFPASTNEATWNSPFAFTTNTWTSPGASGDFATAVSSSTTVYGVEQFYVFESTQMIADVQGWVNDFASNFGWLLKTQSESTGRTARRFGSREFVGIDTNSPPNVGIEFVPPPTITSAQIVSNQFRFSFLAGTNAYRVEFKTAFNATNSWLTLTNIAAPITPTNFLVSDPISSSTRFYRVIPQ